MPERFEWGRLMIEGVCKKCSDAAVNLFESHYDGAKNGFIFVGEHHGEKNELFVDYHDIIAAEDKLVLEFFREKS